MQLQLHIQTPFCFAFIWKFMKPPLFHYPVSGLIPSRYMCFWGERRLGLGWGEGGIMGRDLTPILSPQKHMKLATAYQSDLWEKARFSWCENLKNGSLWSQSIIPQIGISLANF